MAYEESYEDITGRPVCCAFRTMKPVFPGRTFLSWCGRKTNVNQETWILISTLELACFVSIHKLLNLTVFLHFLIANVLTKQGPHAHGLVYKAKL